LYVTQIATYGKKYSLDASSFGKAGKNIFATIYITVETKVLGAFHTNLKAQNACKVLTNQRLFFCIIQSTLFVIG